MVWSVRLLNIVHVVSVLVHRIIILVHVSLKALFSYPLLCVNHAPLALCGTGLVVPSVMLHELNAQHH